MKIPIRLRLVPLCAILAGTALAGCRSDAGDTDFGAVAGDLTPEMHGLTQRNTDAGKDLATSFNQDLRALADDLGRAFYIDQPSRMAPYPPIRTSGQPQ